MLCISNSILFKLGGKEILKTLIFDFELSAEDMEEINGLNKDERIGPDPDTFERDFKS